MPYSAKAVANEFLHLAKDEGRSITPMQLLKLIYFVYGWYWAFANERLLDERVQAWKYGPVVPSIYHEFKSFGNEPINSFATEFKPVHNGGKFGFRIEEPRVPECEAFPRKLITRVWEVYKNYSAIELSRMTHEPGTPWANTPNREVKGTTIDDDSIRNYFVELARQNDASRQPAA
jgi:uncharacterized phage-associated protein